MIKVLHKALNILEYLSGHPEGKTLTEIAAEIGEKTTTASNIVQVLYRRGYLDKCAGGYRIGIGAYLLTGDAADCEKILPELAREPLERLTGETCASAVLSVWRGGNRFVLLRVDDRSNITVNTDCFSDAADIYRTPTGMVLLAYQPDKSIRDYISENGLPKNAAGEDGFRESLRSIRAAGFCQMEQDGVFAAACPVSEPDGESTTAIGLFLPCFRAGDRTALCRTLANTAREIENALRLVRRTEA